MDNGKATIIAAVIAAIATLAAAGIGLYGVTLQKENSALQVENTESQNEISELRDRISKSEETISLLQETISKLRTTQDESASENSNLQAQISGLRTGNKELEAENLELKQENSRLKGEIIPSATHAGKPDAWLCDLAYFDATETWSIGEITKDNWEMDHAHSIDRTDGNGWKWGGGGYRVYNLKGEYVALTGVFFQEFEERASGGEVTLSFYNDDTDELLWQGVVGRAIDPVPFDFSIVGVKKMKLELRGDDAYRTSIGDVGLWYS